MYQLFTLVKYFPSNNLVTRSYGKICGCYSLFAASETHYVWLKMDIVGIPLPVNETSQQRRVLQTQWVIFIPKPVSKYCHALFKMRGVCTLLLSPPTGLKMNKMDEIGSAKNINLCHFCEVFYLFVLCWKIYKPTKTCRVRKHS